MRSHTFGPERGLLVRCSPASDVWAREDMDCLGIAGEGLHVVLLDGAQAVPFVWAPSLGWCYAGNLRPDGAMPSLGPDPFREMVSRLRDRTHGLGLLEGFLLSRLGDPASVLLQLEVLES